MLKTLKSTVFKRAPSVVIENHTTSIRVITYDFNRHSFSVFTYTVDLRSFCSENYNGIKSTNFWIFDIFSSSLAPPNNALFRKLLFGVAKKKKASFLFVLQHSSKKSLWAARTVSSIGYHFEHLSVYFRIYISGHTTYIILKKILVPKWQLFVSVFVFQ